MSSLNKVALIKEKFETCPTQNIANGSVGPTPSCIFSCDDGFELNDNADGCVEVVGVENFEEQFTETVTEAPLDDRQFFENEIVAPAKEYEFPPGHFRYRASSDKFYRYLDETGLAGADADGDDRIDKYTDLGLARHHNTTYLSRNPRSAEEQLAAQAAAKSDAAKEQEEESFVSYLLQMRNHFGDNGQENYYTALSSEGSTDEDDEGGEGGSAVGGFESEGEALLSSGPLLPSTGPGIFVTIAVVGFALMLFGARRS